LIAQGGDFVDDDRHVGKGGREENAAQERRLPLLGKSVSTVIGSVSRPLGITTPIVLTTAEARGGCGFETF
jgi:hypothetical protein